MLARESPRSVTVPRKINLGKFIAHAVPLLKTFDSIATFQAASTAHPSGNSALLFLRSLGAFSMKRRLNGRITTRSTHLPPLMLLAELWEHVAFPQPHTMEKVIAGRSGSSRRAMQDWVRTLVKQSKSPEQSFRRRRKLTTVESFTDPPFREPARVTSYTLKHSKFHFVSSQGNRARSLGNGWWRLKSVRRVPRTRSVEPW